jgi:FKBP-type peptidyl-prolyl cis-trans isomerase
LEIKTNNFSLKSKNLNFLKFADQLKNSFDDITMTFKRFLSLILVQVVSNPFLKCDAWMMPNLGINFGNCDRGLLEKQRHEDEGPKIKNTRRQFIATGVLSAGLILPNMPALAKCTDIESCREIGEKKDQASMAANPIVSLGGGLQYKVLNVGLGDQTVLEKDKVKIIYTLSQANGVYMYSRGFGYNKIDVGDGKKVSDLNLDSLIVQMGAKDIPIGIQQAMMGMKRGERRRIVVPPLLGFETSDWNPQPVALREQKQIQIYQQRLQGRGTAQPPFPAPTIWDVEVLSIRN